MWETVDAMIMIPSIAIAELGSDTGYWVHGKPQRQKYWAVMSGGDSHGV